MDCQPSVKNCLTCNLPKCLEDTLGVEAAQPFVRMLTIEPIYSTLLATAEANRLRVALGSHADAYVQTSDNLGDLPVEHPAGKKYRHLGEYQTDSN